MTCRTWRARSAASYATCTSLAIPRPTPSTTGNGERSRSGCSRRAVCLPSSCIINLDTMHLRIDQRRPRNPWFRNQRAWLLTMSLAVFAGWAATATEAWQQRSLQETVNPDDFRLRVETDLVVLHATVLDKNSRPVADLRQ